MNVQQSELEDFLDLAHGSERAFENIYYSYGPRLFAKIFKLVKSEAHASEILQDVFLILWEHRESIDTGKSVRSFLFKIAENKVYDFFRKAARDKNRELELIALSTDNYTVIEEYKSTDEKLTILHKAIESLPPQRQQVFRLCKLEGKSYKEVGDLLQISVSTISDHIVKGTKSIREYFDRNNNV